MMDFEMKAKCVSKAASLLYELRRFISGPDVDSFLRDVDQVPQLIRRFGDFYKMLYSEILTEEVQKQIRKSDISHEEFKEALRVLRRSFENVDYRQR